jgi:hypothetical protein
MKCIAVLVTTFFGSKHPISVMAFMIGASLSLFLLTLRWPPFFGPGGRIDGVDVLTSRPNRVRCAIDLALVHCFACAFLAVMTQSHWRSQCVVDPNVIMMRVFPATLPLVLLFSYRVVPTFMYGQRSLDLQNKKKRQTTKTLGSDHGFCERVWHVLHRCGIQTAKVAPEDLGVLSRNSSRAS